MKRWKTIACLTIAATLAAGAFSLYGCGSKKFNVMLVTLDTTRADRLRCYGYQQIETPGFNEIARNGVLFRRAFSHTPLTLPTHLSILSGMVPMSHGVIDNGGYKVPDEIVTLAEVLRAKGFATSAFVSAKVLDQEFNLNQGFETYDQEGINPQGNSDESLLVAERKGDKTTDAALKWLGDNKGKPWFMWVHYYDPHMTYSPPEPYKHLYANPYDGEIAFMDSQFQRLMKALRDDGLWDNTVIVVIGDHGESLGDHQEKTHSNFLYDSTAHVPLIIRLPGLKPGEVKAAVAQIDIMPTVLSFLGIESPSQVEGEDLQPLMKGEEPEERFAFLESDAAFLHYGWSPLSAVTDGRYKFIKAPKPELYDTHSDPGELKNLYSPDNQIALKLKAKLEELRRGYERMKLRSQAAEVDAKMQAQLEALGYVVNGNNGDPKLAAGKDPKDFIDLLPAFMGLSMMAKVSNFAEVLNICEKILKRDPDNPTAMFRRAWALFGLGRFDESLPAYDLYFKTHNETFQGWMQIGAIYVRISQDAKINNQDEVWRINVDKAIEAFSKAMSLDPRAEAAYYLGRLELEQGKLEQARQRFESKPLEGTEWGSLGMAKYYQLQDRPGLAESEYARIEDREIQPNLIYWQEYAQFLLSQQRAAEALALLEKAVKKDGSLAIEAGFVRAITSARAAAGVAAPEDEDSTAPAPAAAPSAPSARPAPTGTSPAGSGTGSAPPGP